MTKKEKLFGEVNALVEKYNSMIDGHENYRKREKYSNNYRHNWKIVELETEIVRMNNLIDEFNRDLKIKCYWLSDEGAARKKVIEKKMDSIENEIDEIDEIWQNEIIKLISPFLNSDWVIRPFNTRIDIGLRDVESKYPDGILFGHSFDIYFNNKWNYNDGTKIEINYGTMGSFDPIVNKSRVIYLQGMSNIVSNIELLEKIHQAFKQWNKILRDKRREYDRLNSELKNPLAA
jgi:hypothetical protein